MRDKCFSEAGMDYFSMMERIEKMCEKYPFLSVTSLGESILGKSIPILSVGEGEKNIIYIGAHGGDEWMISAALVKFIDDLSALYVSGGKIFNNDIRTLFSLRSISVVPMINPDGIEYNLKGISEDNPLYERVMSMNSGVCDLSGWRSNARGVDLNKNYIRESFIDTNNNDIFSGNVEGRAGEWSESEPETGALCNYLRYNVNVSLLASLHMSDGSDRYCVEGDAAFTGRVRNKLGALLGFSQKEESASDMICGLSQWSANNVGVPVVSVFCSPYSINNRGNVYHYYSKLKRFLFDLPYTV